MLRQLSQNYRWRICALLFFATTIAYIDRGVVGYLEKTLEHIFHWTSVQYSYVIAAFQFAYAVGLASAGRLTDKLGTRRSFALAITAWSFAAMLPGAAFSTWTFGIAMFLLGLGEAANFPACLKAVAEWFPRSERALATGIFNSGANIGNIAVPILVPSLTLSLGWRGAFVATGALGFIWLAFWLRIYTTPAPGSPLANAAADTSETESLESQTSIPLSRILSRKEMWAFASAKFLTDPIWWFYLFWLPRFLQESFHLSLSQNRLPVAAVYTISCAGSIFGGALPAILLKRSMSLNAARKLSLLTCACCVLPVLYAPFSRSLWAVVLLVGLAAAAHQGWSANLFTLSSDLFPKGAVGTVIGFGGMMGAVGGTLFQLLIGRIVTLAGSYTPAFLIACTAYLVAFAVIQSLSPRLKPAKLT